MNCLIEIIIRSTVIVSFVVAITLPFSGHAGVLKIKRLRISEHAESCISACG